MGFRSLESMKTNDIDHHGSAQIASGKKPTPTPFLKAPFPWFGGKSRVANQVWERFGEVPCYVEPFFGSGAVLLARPHHPRIETVNDKDGYVSNFWRALKADPESVAKFANSPVFENDLHARHAWLLQSKVTLPACLEGDPDFYDCKIAGWWAWGQSCWIGSGFCSGKGPWHVQDGMLVRSGDGQQGLGVSRQRPHFGDAGRGVNRNLDPGELIAWFQALAQRLRRVSVCCGDWSRLCVPTVTWKNGISGVFLDPPYSAKSGRALDLYAADSDCVAEAAREWAVQNSNNSLLRIALCGYEGEHDMPDDWECVAWKARRGMGNHNRHRERIWFSPACLKPVSAS
jgi:site-specific DNA-adenine methylase